MAWLSFSGEFVGLDRLLRSGSGRRRVSMERCCGPACQSRAAAAYIAVAEAIFIAMDSRAAQKQTLSACWGPLEICGQRWPDYG